MNFPYIWLVRFLFFYSMEAYSDLVEALWHNSDVTWKSRFPNRRQSDCFFNSLFRLTATEISQLMMTSSNGNIFRVTGHLCGNSPVPGEFPAPVTRSFAVFFDLRLNERLNKQSWGWWFETLSRPLWRHCNVRVLALCTDNPLWMEDGLRNHDYVIKWKSRWWISPTKASDTELWCFLWSASE